MRLSFVFVQDNEDLYQLLGKRVAVQFPDDVHFAEIEFIFSPSAQLGQRDIKEFKQELGVVINGERYAIELSENRIFMLVSDKSRVAIKDRSRIEYDFIFVDEADEEFRLQMERYYTDLVVIRYRSKNENRIQNENRVQNETLVHQV